jgi:hypothetical protein
VLAFATLMTFASAIDSDSSLNSFSESEFSNGNSSLDVSSLALSFNHLVPRQLQCVDPGYRMMA